MALLKNFTKCLGKDILTVNKSVSVPALFYHENVSKLNYQHMKLHYYCAITETWVLILKLR